MRRATNWRSHSAACWWRGRVLREFEREVARFHDARRGEQARVAGEEERLGIAVAEGLEFAQPSGEDRRDAVERKLGVNAQEALGLARGEVLLGIEAQAALELGQFFGGQREADGEGVAAEASEEIGAGFDGGEEHEAVDGAAGAVGYTVFDADDDGRLGGALDDARGEDADDAAMPAVAVDDEEAVGGDFRVGCEAGFDGGERGGFHVAALAVEALEFGGELGGAVRVARGKELDDVGGHVHAAGGVDARREAEGDVEAGELFGCGIERGRGKERAQAGAHGTAQLAQAEGGDGAVFAAGAGTASAMVAMAAILRKLGRVFSRARSGSRRSSSACASLSAMAAPQRLFSGYGHPG